MPTISDRLRWTVVGATLATCFLSTLACPSPITPRNVVLISIDTLRADHLGCYGYDRQTTPHLDSLAARGVRFERAFTVASWTLPAHMSLMTSRYPHGHGVERQDQSLAKDVTVLAELLKTEGVRTGGVISWFFVSARYGFDRGFEEFFELLPEKEDLSAYRKAEDVIDTAIDWLGGRGAERRPFFLFVHLFDPHIDYSPPSAYAERFRAGDSTIDGSYASLQPYIRGLRENAPRIDPEDLKAVVALYDAEVRYVDDQIGRLLATLEEMGLADSTLVVVTSDHGEEFDDHGSMEGHQWTLYDEVLRIPLILRAPGGPAARVEQRLAEIIDIAPTILDWMGIAPPDEFLGASLLSSPGLESAGREWVFSKIERFNSKQAVRSANHKLIHTAATGTNAFGVPIRPGFELYDLATDPGEKNDLYVEGSPLVREMQRALLGWLTTAGATPSAEDVEFTEEQRKRLRALGYLD